MKPQRMFYTYRADCKAISSAQAIRWSKISKLFTAIVPRKATFVRTMQSLLSYVEEFDEDYNVRSVDVRITDVMDDMMYSNFFAANCRTVYIGYKRVNRMRT